MGEIPILKIGDCLLVSIQVDMHDRLAMALQDDLTERIVADRARGVMIDISALEIVDSFIGRMLNNIAAMSRVLDAVTVVVGMRPAVAITLVELGLGADRRAHRAERGQGPRADPPHHRQRRAATMPTENDETMPVRTSDDVVRVRQAVRARAVAAGFSLVDQTKIVTAASEIAPQHGGLRRRRHAAHRGAAQRPAPRRAPDLRRPGARASPTSTLALTDGYTTGGGLGLGLSGAKRLCNEFDIKSTPGQGTVVTLARWT